MKYLFATSVFFTCLLAGLCLGVGCTTGPDGHKHFDEAAFRQAETNAAPILRGVALAGTKIALRQNPDWRADFETARNALGVLAKSDKIDYSALAGILEQLPVKELQSEDATLAIETGTAILQQYGKADALAAHAEDLRPLVVALFEGMDAALRALPLPPKQ